MPNLFDQNFINELQREDKHFIEILDIWADPDISNTNSTYRFVSYKKSITFNGKEYLPLGALRNPITQSSNNSSTSLSLTLDGIDKIDTGTMGLIEIVRKTNLRGSPILLRRIPVNYTVTTPKILFRGYIGEVKCASITIQFICESLFTRWLRKPIPNRLAGPGCQVPFGSKPCGVIQEQGVNSLENVITRDGYPALMEGFPIILNDGFTLRDTYILGSIADEYHFHNGYVQIWKQIYNNIESNHPYKGFYSFIKSFDPSTATINLEFPLPLLPSEGGNVKIRYQATCGHTKKECYKWQNLDNYKGMDVPKIPILNVSSERY